MRKPDHVETAHPPEYRFSLPSSYSPPTSTSTTLMTPLPPQVLTEFLHDIKKNRPLFLTSYPINDLSLVERIIQAGSALDLDLDLDLSSSKEKLKGKGKEKGKDDSTHLACMYGILYFVLSEWIFLSHPIGRKYDLDRALALCERNFDLLLNGDDVRDALPGFGSVLAFVLGAMKAQSQPRLSYTLLSTATTQCLSLTYTRDYTHGDSSNSRRLFWTVYMLERRMSYALGRASRFMDEDVDVGHPIRSSKKEVRPWDELFLAKVELGRIMRVVAGVFRGEDEGGIGKESAVGGLAVEMQGWIDGGLRIYADGVNNRPLFKLSRQILEVQYYSILAALLRGPVSSTSTATSSSPASTGQTHIKPECFDVARLTLQSFIRCCSAYQTLASASHLSSPGISGINNPLSDWTLISPLLTPIIITTLLSIASSNPSDVSLLMDLVKSLHTLRLRSQSNTPPPDSVTGTRGSRSGYALERIYTFSVYFSKIASGLVKRRLENMSVPGWRDTWVEDKIVDASATTRGVGSGSVRVGGGAESDSMSVLRQVMDEDIRDFVGEDGAEEVFGVLGRWMRGRFGLEFNTVLEGTV